MSDQNIAALIEQGRACLDRSDFRGAIARFEQAAAQAHAWGEHDNELVALGWLPAAWGSIANHQKEVEAATRLLARARALRRPDYEIAATLRLAEAIADLDLRTHWRELKPLLLQGLESSINQGAAWYELYHRMLLGIYAIRMNDLAEGNSWLQQTLNALTPSIERNSVPHCLFRVNIYGALSLLNIKHAQMPDAVRYAEMAVGLARNERNPSFIAEATLVLIRAYHAAGMQHEALALLNVLLPDARQHGWKGIEQHAEYLLSVLEYAQGNVDAAEVAAQRACSLAHAMKLREEEIQALLSVAHILYAQQRTHDATTAATTARRIAQELNYADYYAQADALISQHHETKTQTVHKG